MDRFPDNGAKSAAWGVFSRLDTLDAAGLLAQQDRDIDGNPEGLPFLRFADDAREAFSDWHHDLERKLRATEAEGLEGALSKFRHHVPALALALHVIDGGVGAVALAPTLRALALSEYFESHARRLHGSNRRVTVRAARSLLSKAQAGALPDPFTAREVYIRDWSGLADKSTVNAALDLLTAHGWLVETDIAAGIKGGRPTTSYSLIEGARRG